MAESVSELKAWWEHELALLELGQYVDEHYTGGLTVDGKPMSNMQMKADQHNWRQEKLRRIAEHGCCGEGYDVWGRCYGIGLCPQSPQFKEWEQDHGQAKRNAAVKQSVSKGRRRTRRKKHSPGDGQGGAPGHQER